MLLMLHMVDVPEQSSQIATMISAVQPETVAHRLSAKEAAAESTD